MTTHADEQLLSLVEKKHEYGDVYTFIFKPEREVIFAPGMYSHVRLPQGEEGQRTREFSIASAPSEGNIYFSTHIRAGSLFKQKFGALKKDDSVEIFKIKGEFLLPEDEEYETVLIAGGIGITPFRSMLIESHAMRRKVMPTLIHVAEDGYLYEDELSELPIKQKRITRNQIEGTLKDAIDKYKDAMFYVSGPPPFVLTIDEHLKRLDVYDERIKNDEFSGYEDMQE